MFGEVACAASPMSTTWSRTQRVEGDLLDHRGVDVRCGVDAVEQRGGGIGELGEQLREPLGRGALGAVGVSR